MKIYDRYGGSSANAQAERRAAFLKICLKPVGYGLVWLALLGIAYIAEKESAVSRIFVWGAVCIIALTVEECLRPLRGNDLFTFGYDGRNFAAMGINGKPRRIVDVEKLGRIRIVEAKAPYRRSKQKLRYSGSFAIYERYGARKRINGKKRFVADAMALLEPRDYGRRKYSKWVEDWVLDITGEFLCGNVGFVLRGENKKVFIRLLKSTDCPVIIRRDFYSLHQKLLDKLFAQAGMDMRRLMIEGDEGK